MPIAQAPRPHHSQPRPPLMEGPTLSDQPLHPSPPSEPSARRIRREAPGTHLESVQDEADAAVPEEIRRDAAVSPAHELPDILEEDGEEEEEKPHLQVPDSRPHQEPLLNPVARVYPPPPPVDPGPVPEVPHLPAGGEEVAAAALLRRDGEDVEGGLALPPLVHGVPEPRAALLQRLLRHPPHPPRGPGCHQPVQAHRLHGPDDVGS